MPRGFGRGAKSVGIVTHAQAKQAGKKVPKGLRGVRQKKRTRYQQKNDETKQLEKSLGLNQDTEKKTGPKSLAEEIAGIYIPHIVNRREKGLKSLRKQIISAVKDVKKARSNKQKKKN